MKDEPLASEFTISRIFDAPRQLVWDAWTQAERLAGWWGPKGFTIKVAKLDLSPGGTFHYSMVTPDGHEMWGRFVYQEIAPPERLVLVNSFSDAAGNIARAPFSQEWPLEVRNVMTLSENSGKTTLVLRGSPVNATPEERRKFDSFHQSMNQGFKGTFDQLTAYLASQ
ncbi:MAG TPA: SRPBCC domain-containing protein [Opitutaceae bacterium]|jgi:uncharacterized protein YndB with AHSA1/START domain|nr:SRPBCC domain-containing protein [Opitutaceae bacterium]